MMKASSQKHRPISDRLMLGEPKSATDVCRRLHVLRQAADETGIVPTTQRGSSYRKRGSYEELSHQQGQ